MKGDEKRNAVFTVAVISALILIFAIADFVHEDRVFSVSENRLLASKPEFSAEALLDGTYTARMETYVTDQFVSRDKWIAIKTGMDIILQKQEINGVYLGKDDYLIEQHLPENYTEEQTQKKLALLEKLVDKWDAEVMLVPTADNILVDKLPANAPYFDQKQFLDTVRNLVGEEHYIDVYHALSTHADEQIYYRTDHHWTSLGAYYGYQAWAEARGIQSYPYDTQNMGTVTEEFLGTLHSRVNLDRRADSITYFPETTVPTVKITYDMTKVSDALYESSYLETKNKYGFFLDDNHALVEIDTERQGGGTLFVIKDSYANCFVPLLLPHYSRIYMLDLRYYNGRLSELMEKYGEHAVNSTGEGMEVMILYNCIHFLEDFGYYE